MNKITVKCFVAAFMGILAGNSNVSAAGMTLNAMMELLWQMARAILIWTDHAT